MPIIPKRIQPQTKPAQYRPDVARKINACECLKDRQQRDACRAVADGASVVRNGETLKF